MENDSFDLSMKIKGIIKELKNLENLFDFGSLNKNPEIFSNKNKKVVGKFKLETPKHIWVDEFVCLRSKMYSFKCEDDGKNKLKVISKSYSKSIKVTKYYNCLFGGKNQKECDECIIRSLNHEMCLQLVQKSTLAQFDDK